MVEIRLVGPTDAALFVRIADDVFDAPHRRRSACGVSRRSGAGDGGGDRGRCARRGGAKSGRRRHIYIDNPGVAPAWQRRRVATRLIDTLADHARIRGCASIWVATQPGNDPADALYRHRTAVQSVAYYEWRL